MFDFLREPRAGLIPFLVAGDGGLSLTERLADALIAEGASALEIGVPFTDALADGPVIQKASDRALVEGTTLASVLELVARLSRRHPGFPFIVFSYFNPIFAFGVEDYVKQAKASGVAATLIVDLPLEEAEDVNTVHQDGGLSLIFLASPTTSDERLRKIGAASSSFVYYVSRTGVTGVSQDLSPTLMNEIGSVRRVTRKPVAVGFGVSNGTQAAQVASRADAVVVGSAFVRLMETSSGGDEAESKVRALARELVTAIRDVQKEVGP